MASYSTEARHTVGIDEPLHSGFPRAREGAQQCYVRQPAANAATLVQYLRCEVEAAVRFIFPHMCTWSGDNKQMIPAGGKSQPPRRSAHHWLRA
jgi:hypothetical protein